MVDDVSMHVLSADLETRRTILVVEGSLRPRTLAEYIGQAEVKANLSVLLQAAKQRGEAADHILLYGPPGLARRPWPRSSPASSGSTSATPPGRPSSGPVTWPRS
jgi:hypothetical protein